MMFDETQVFEGLTAWFSTSVPASLKSRWVKSGGLVGKEFSDVDYIFSSNASAKDTLRIFDSHNEELTIFNSSLIEDAVKNGKIVLSGKYCGDYILIHPAYQKEIDNFYKNKCPRLYRSDVRLTGMKDGKRSGFHESKIKNSMKKAKKTNDDEDSDEWEFEDSSLPKVLDKVKKNIAERIGDDDSDMWDLTDDSEISLTSMNARTQPKDIESLPREIKNTEQEMSDEWDFKDDPDLHTKNLKDAKNKNVQRDRRHSKLCRSSHLNLVAAPQKQPWITVQPNKTSEDVRNLSNNPSATFSISDTSHDNYSQADEKQQDQGGYHSQKPVEQDREQQMHCGDCQEMHTSHSQHTEQGESYLDDTKSRNKVSPDKGIRPHFLSSMDDGFVHIDDITLPDTPICDFIPNHAGCRVDAK